MAQIRRATTAADRARPAGGLIYSKAEMAIFPEQQQASSGPEWLPEARVPLAREAVVLIERLLEGRFPPEPRNSDPTLLDFSYNENPLGPGVLAQKAVIEEVSQLHRYPLASSPMLRHRLSVQLGVSEDEIVVGCGATGLLGMIVPLVLTAGARAVFSRSSLFAYRRSVIAAGGEPVEVPLTPDFHHDLDAMVAEVRRGAKLVLISNPHNPTGTVFDHAQFGRFLESVPQNVLVVLDEAYLEFAEEGSQLPRGVALTRTYPNLLLLRTFSKVHGLANARVGYAVGQAPGIAAIEGMCLAMNPGGVGALGQVAAEAALGDHEHIERSILHVTIERLRAYRVLDTLAMPYLRSHANFIMAYAGPDTPRLVSFLRQRNVLITSGDLFGYPEWFRFSLQTRDDNDHFYSLLQAFHLDYRYRSSVETMH